MIPGKSSNCILAQLYSMTLGIHVRVGNSYDAPSDSVYVRVLSNVDFLTDGKPIRATLTSPDFKTSSLHPFQTFWKVLIVVSDIWLTLLSIDPDGIQSLYEK